MAFIDSQFSNGVLTWTLNRSERFNAIGVAIADELIERSESFAGLTQAPRILCIRANPIAKQNRRFWIAGGDLKELAALSAAGAEHYMHSMTRFTTWLSRLPIPVIALIEGEAIGGGAELALAADIRLASKDACLHFKQLEIGLATGYGGAHRLVDLVGLAHAQRLLLKTVRLDCQDAIALGLFHEAAAPAQMEELLNSWTAHFLALSKEALAAQKSMLHAAVYHHPGARAEGENTEFLKIWRNPQHAAFLNQFVARSTP